MTNPHRAEPASEPIDWMAEFATEEPAPTRGPRAAADAPVRRPHLLVLPPPPARSIAPPPRSPDEPREPLGVMTWATTRLKTSSFSWPDRRIAIAGIAAIVLVVGVVATATAMRRWGPAAQAVDAASAPVLVRTPAAPSIQAPATSPLAARPLSVPRERTPAPAIGGRAAQISRPGGTTAKQARVEPKNDRQRTASVPVAAPPPAAATVTSASLPPAPQSPSFAATPVSLSAPPPAATPVTTPVTTPVATPAPAPVRSAPDPPAPPPAATERALQTAAVRTVLDRYRTAFSTLSVEGLGAIWRGANTRALARAFEQLESQTFEFDTCRIDLFGDLAEASCGGRARFVPKVGARTPRVQSRLWTFRLVRAREGWIIDQVSSR